MRHIVCACVTKIPGIYPLIIIICGCACVYVCFPWVVVVGRIYIRDALCVTPLIADCAREGDPRAKVRGWQVKLSR